MLPRNSSWLRSAFPIVLTLLVCCVLAPAAPAEDLNLAGLVRLEAPAADAPHVSVQAPAPLDLSGLHAIAGPLEASGSLQLAALRELTCRCPDGCECRGECRCVRPAAESRTSAPASGGQLVLPAARPPAAVPATTAQPAGGFWQQQCGKRGCRMVWVSTR